MVGIVRDRFGKLIMLMEGKGPLSLLCQLGGDLYSGRQRCLLLHDMSRIKASVESRPVEIPFQIVKAELNDTYWVCVPEKGDTGCGYLSCENTADMGGEWQLSSAKFVRLGCRRYGRMSDWRSNFR